MKKLNIRVYDNARKKQLGNELLRKTLCKTLDEELIKHIDFLQIDNSVLTLSVKSAVWASRLRFFSQAILSALQQNSIQVSKVIMKVQAQPEPDELKRAQKKFTHTITEASLRNLSTTAAHISEPRLQKALENLVNHARGRNKERDEKSE